MTLLPTRQRFCGTSIRPCRIGAVAVFLVVAVAASRVDASCGDWLAGHEVAGHEATSVNTLFGLDESMPKAPCNGPNCRRSPQHLPFLPPGPSRQFDSPDRWCQLAEVLSARPPFSSLLPAEADLIAVEGFRPSIERPPRV